MFVRRSFLPLAYSLPFLTPDGDPPGNPPPTPPADPPEVKFDDAQQRKLNDLLAAERKTTEDRVKTDLAAQAAAAKKKADEDRERTEAEGRGEFDKVKKGLEDKVSSVETERDQLKADHDLLVTHFEKDYEDRVKAVPADIWTELKPADDAALTERITAVERAERLAKKLDKQKPRGSGFDPAPGGDRGINVKDEIARARSRTNL